MGVIAESQKNAMLDAYGGDTTYTATDFYAQLHTGDPGSAGTSNVATETTRQQVTFAAASGGSKASDAAVTWTNVSTTETYSWVSFWTASTAGTYKGKDDLPVSKAVTAGDTFTIPLGDVTLSIAD